jgi:hypothetical protein
MRSPFYWWCKRQCKSFAHQFKTDWQFRAAAIVLAVELAALAYYASVSFWLGAFVRAFK